MKTIINWQESIFSLFTTCMALQVLFLFNATGHAATIVDNNIAGVTSVGEPGVSLAVSEIMMRENKAAISGVVKPSRIIPLRTNPLRQGNPQNPESSVLPAQQDGRQLNISRPGPFTPQTIGSVNFTGATLADANAFPPDSMGAAGPTQFIVAINGRIRSFNKNTGVADGVLNVTPDTFFSPVMTIQSGTFTSDPRIRYDRLTGRWFITIIDVPAGTGAIANRVLIAVSNNGTITAGTTWTYFFYQYTGSSFADYPTLGIDQNALYIGVNIFSTTAGAFTGTDGLVVRKSSILGAGPIVVTRFAGLVPNASSAGPYTPQGVDNSDPAATEGYFIGVDNATFSTLMLRRVSNPGGIPTISANIAITVSTTAFPSTVPHLGNTGGTNGNLDALDDRLFAATMRKGRLWTAHNINVTSAGVGSSVGTRNGSRWYELQGIATGQIPALAQSGTVFDSAATNPRFYWIPSIMVSGQGHAAMGFSTAGAAERINAGTVGRLANDTLGTMETPQLYTASTTAYNPPGDTGGTGGRRWGDYSYTSVDPDDDMTMWTIQEFCNAANSYGLRVVKLIAPPPATPSAALPATIPLTQSSVNVTISGTSVSGSGFFDPGAGFVKRISASVSGGVTVNSVTYTDPTHITLNISTVGATPGIQTVTVTNPDGQSIVSGGLITIPPLYTLDVTFIGNGEGSVTITNLGNQTVCNTACSPQIPGGSQVNLHADPDQFSIFSGWTGACTILTDCIFSMNGPVQATANLTIDAAHSVRIGPTNFSTINSAYQAASTDGTTIEAWGINFPEVLTFNLAKNVTLKGGFNSTYSTRIGMSTISDPLIVKSGSLKVQNLTVIKK